MNQLTGKYANVVLSVEEGRSMDFIKNDIYISACLNSRVLESDRTKPGEKAVFNTELIWETEKKEIRRIRIASQPLRVECISIDSYNRKERIGFALLNLRSAPIVSLKDAGVPLVFRWQKLIGCQADRKKCHPEIYLSLSIRDHLLNDTETIPQSMPFITEEESKGTIVIDSPFSIKYLDDGHIQIGEDEENSRPFSFNLLIKEARNLDALLPEVLVFQQNREKYYLAFRMFGVVIKTKPFYKDLHQTIALNEKVVVRILSTSDILCHFLKSAVISINFYCGPDKLGVTQLSLDNVSFKEDNKECFFKFPSPNGIVPFKDKENSPVIEVKTWLNSEKVTVSEEEFAPTRVVSNIHNKPSGDDVVGSVSLEKLEKAIGKSQSETIFVETGEKTPTNVSEEIVVANIPLTSPTIDYDVNDSYKKFSLFITLNSLIWRKPLKENCIIFKFLHPRCASYITILKQLDNFVGREIPIGKLKIRINYISTDEKINAMINAWPAKLILMNEKEQILSEQHEIFLPNISSQSSQLKYGADFNTIRSLEPLAKIHMTIEFDTYDIEHKDKDSSLVFSPPLIDEIISFENLVDLEKWKISQKEIFESKVVEEKNKEMEMLKESWDEGKCLLEEKLQSNIQKCRLLQEQLQDKLENLKVEKCLVEKRTSSNIFEDIFKESWHKYSKSEPKDIIIALSRLQRDNEHLRDIIKEQAKTIKSAEKTALTKEQTSKLLQDVKGLEKQFEEAQKAKEYFKEQWKKACEEIHDLKIEENRQIQSYICTKKEELSRASATSIHGDEIFNSLSYENIVSSHSNKSISAYTDVNIQ